MKKTNKNIDKFAYPHPIIKTFASVAQEKQSVPPFAYQNFHTQNANTISHKLIRSTHLNPLMGSSFSLLLQPLHPNVEINSFQSTSVLSCKKCKATLNLTTTYKLSFPQHKCKFCGTITQQDVGSGQFINLNVFDKKNSQILQSQNIQEKKLLFAIQANQYLHKKSIITQIFQCLNALVPTISNSKLNRSISKQTQMTQSQKQQDYILQNKNSYYSQNQGQSYSVKNYKNTQNQTQNQNDLDLESQPHQKIKVGFILFDNERNYLLNMVTKQIAVISIDQFNKDKIQQFPLNQNQLLMDISQINLQQIQEIIQDIMYQSYQIQTSCLYATLQLSSLLAHCWKIQTRFFCMSFDRSQVEKKENQTDSKNSSSLKNNKKTLKLDKIKVDSRVQIDVFSYGLYKQLIRIGLNSNIGKFFQYKTLGNSDIYYYLYHKITQQTYYNAQIQIYCSQLISCTKQIYTIPILNSNTPIILDFSLPSKIPKQILYQKQKNDISFQKDTRKGKQQYLLSTQCIQIKINFDNLFQRVFTYQVQKISADFYNQPYLLNDQTFFYVLVCKLLQEKNDKSGLGLRKLLHDKNKQIIERILQIQDDNFSIPKNLSNFFMYSFMMIQNQLCDKKNTYYLCQKNNFLQQGLQTITKLIYPKVYQFYPQLKPLKFRPKSFLNDTIRIIDNGKVLAIVIGDEVKLQTLLKLFKIKDLDQALQWKHIPYIDTQINRKLHQAINMLRELNQMYYMPLRIMRFDSQQFQEMYANNLYIDEQHRKFFQKLAKN